MENLLPKGMLGTPRRTVVVGVAALVLATILLLVYLSHYRSSVKSASANVTVLRAKAFIHEGTTAESLAKNGLFEVTAVPREQLKEGAITDAAVLHGEVALSDIYPAQQLTIAEFGTTATSSALSGSSQLLGTKPKTGTWRAMSIELDASHGIVPQAQTDDHVDVYAQMSGKMGLLLANVLVLAAPNQTASGTTAPTSTNYILRVPSSYAPKFALAAGSGSIWFALRPQEHARPTTQNFVTDANFFGAS